MWSYVPKLHVLFLSNSLTQRFCLYIELLQCHLVRWSSLDKSLQLQALSYFHIELCLRCFGGPGSASDNVRFINDAKKLIFCRLLKYKSL